MWKQYWYIKLRITASLENSSAGVSGAAVFLIYTLLVHIFRYYSVWTIHESRKILNSLLSIVSLLDSASLDIFRALSSEISDFEDAVMVETALRSDIDCIITRNQKDYKKSHVPVYTASEFLKKFL